MRNEELLFDDGLVSFGINGGKATITINPTDADFFGKVYDSFSTLAKKQDKFEDERKTVKKEEVFDFARKVSAEMRGVIDEIFAPVCDASSICDAIFGDMNLYAYAGGLPVWCNFLFAVMDKADDSISKEQKLTEPAIKKYTSKYHR
jgi:hypothetical protein